MGMWDRETQLTKEFEPNSGKKFILWEGEYIGVSKHIQFGENQKGRVLVSPIGDDGKDTGDKRHYIVFGVMAEQIQRMEQGDLPAVAQIAKDGNANVLALITKELPVPF